MNKKSICKVLTILMLISFLSGCSFIKDSTNNKIKTDEMNAGNEKKIIVNGKNIYFIDTSNKNKLYVVDDQFKNKKLISDRYFLRMVDITDKEIYFIQKTILDEKIPLYELCSIDLNGDSYKSIVKDVNSAIFLNDKLYYYRVTDEAVNDDGISRNFSNFCVFDINLNKESIIDEKVDVYINRLEIFKNKIYYDGAENKFLEYNPSTEEKNQLDVSLTFFYRYSDDSIYAYKGSTIEKTNLLNNEKRVILPESEKIYNIWDMNVTKDYIFFLAQDTKEVKSEIFRLNLYRVKKDGSELKKIYYSDYTKDIIHVNHNIYNFGDKLLLYEKNEENLLLSRNKFQLIDYNGKEINSSSINN